MQITYVWSLSKSEQKEIKIDENSESICLTLVAEEKALSELEELAGIG